MPYNSPMKPTSNSVAPAGAPPLLAAYWYVRWSGEIRTLARVTLVHNEVV